MSLTNTQIIEEQSLLDYRKKLMKIKFNFIITNHGKAEVSSLTSFSIDVNIKP